MLQRRDLKACKRQEPQDYKQMDYVVVMPISRLSIPLTLLHLTPNYLDKRKINPYTRGISLSLC
jgi:hypothetical protein